MPRTKEERLRNHIAKDLGSPKYRQRVKEVKRRKLIEQLREKEFDDELEDYDEQ